MSLYELREMNRTYEKSLKLYVNVLVYCFNNLTEVQEVHSNLYKQL